MKGVPESQGEAGWKARSSPWRAGRVRVPQGPRHIQSAVGSDVLRPIFELGPRQWGTEHGGQLWWDHDYAGYRPWYRSTWQIALGREPVPSLTSTPETCKDAVCSDTLFPTSGSKLFHVPSSVVTSYPLPLTQLLVPLQIFSVMTGMHPKSSLLHSLVRVHSPPPP